MDCLPTTSVTDNTEFDYLLYGLHTDKGKAGARSDKCRSMYQSDNMVPQNTKCQAGEHMFPSGRHEESNCFVNNYFFITRHRVRRAQI